MRLFALQSGRKPLHWAETLCLDFVATVLTKCTTSPIDAVKIALQCEPEMVRRGSVFFLEPFTGALDAFVRQFCTQAGFARIGFATVINCVKFVPQALVVQVANAAIEPLVGKCW